jgi:ABC-2 type transport system ATP-binding protein
MTHAITTSKLSKLYTKGMRRQQVAALASLDLEVRQGEVFGFIGSNGAGKSTTIKILMSLIKPTSGQAWIFGQPASTPAARARVGYLSEHPHFYDFLTPVELLDLLGAMRQMNPQNAREQAQKLLALVSLSEAAERKIRGFSKGMVQRLGIAAALLGDPDLLILDEPMSGLDPLGRHLVATIIRDLQQQGKTIFFSTHIIPDIETLCDRVAILVQGQQKYVGSIQEALYPAGNRFEMTVRMPEQWAQTQSGLDSLHLLWHKEGLYKFELAEAEITNATQIVIKSNGSIVNLEPKRRSLEDLFLDLSGQFGKNRVSTLASPAP